MTKFLIALCALTLTACGFQPLYAPQNGDRASVYVEQIEGRDGFTLRKALQQRLIPGLPGADEGAVLTIELNKRLGRLAFQPDEAASRTDVIASATYVLTMKDGAVSGRANAEASYNVPDQPFADIAAQIDASERTMNLLARRIVDDLRLQLADREAPEAQ